MKFADLSLQQPVQQALSELNYDTPTPIQAQAIPAGLEGRDVMGIAQTGTGKTAAFLIPVLQHLSNKGRARPNHPKALILAPTRELANQISQSVKEYGKHLKPRHTVIYGGVSQRPQVQDLRRGSELVIATPGRLLDLMRQGHIRMDDVEYFVLDEADRMLDMGFLPDVKDIIKNMPQKKQTFFFSATMSRQINQLASQLFTSPVRIEIAPEATTAENVEQNVLFVSKHDKKELLIRLLNQEHLGSVLVFTRTKRNADRVAQYLSKKGHSAVSMHGDKSQNKRQQALERFSDRKVRVLVATDVAARGIDVDDISHVINFELPDDTENYIHRIGRTGRAGASGTALSFCSAQERSQLNDIERMIKAKIPHMEHPLHCEQAKNATGQAARRKGRSGGRRKRSGPKQRYGKKR